MKSLEQEAEKLIQRENFSSHEAYADCLRTFNLGAETALRLLSEKEGREWKLAEGIVDCGPQIADQYGNVVVEGPIISEKEGEVVVTEAAPLRARYERELFELREKQCEVLAKDMELLKAAQSEIEYQKTIIGASFKREQTLRAQLLECKEQRNQFVRGHYSPSNAAEEITLCDLELQKKGQGDE